MIGPSSAANIPLSAAVCNRNSITLLSNDRRHQFIVLQIPERGGRDNAW